MLASPSLLINCEIACLAFKGGEWRGSFSFVLIAQCWITFMGKTFSFWGGGHFWTGWPPQTFQIPPDGG